MPQNGFACKIRIFCPFCKTINNECSTSPSENGLTEVNQLMTNAFIYMGSGYSGLEKLGCELNTNIMSKTTFAKYTNITHKKTVEICDIILKQSVEKVRQAYNDLSTSSTEEDIVNITVSYDGSWHTRGHTSNQGLGIVIDNLTGLAVDYVILSKNCAMCNRMETKLTDEHEFENWKKMHIESGVCEKNFDGSSGSMEIRAAEILWRRSIEKHNLRYTIMLSDGDCKTFSHLESLNIYPGYKIEKQECINHIGKRLYTALKKVVHDCSVQKTTIGGSKAGSLTDDKIRKLQGYYTHAIKQNAPNI